MHRLVAGIILIILSPTNTFPLAEDAETTTLSCGNRLTPLFTNETFCSPTPTTKIFTCCHSNENNYEKDNALKTALLGVIDGKFAAMGTSLKAGEGVVGGISCINTTTTNLLKTTATSLATLSSVKWKDLLDISSNFECRLKLARASLCGSGECVPLPLQTPPTPCPSLCTNLIRGCFHTLSENILLPWKHAVNSVRTAIRLLLSTTRDCVSISMETRALEELQISLNSFREVFAWVDGGVCGGHGDGDCFGGEFGVEGLPLSSSSYTKATPPWSTHPSKFTNPEFRTNSELSIEYESKVAIVREELLGVAKHLEKHWPLTNNPHDNGQNSDLQSDEEQEQEQYSDEVYDDDDEEDDDFDLSGSGGYHDNNFQTDDEDLYSNHGEGEGSGDNDEMVENGNTNPTQDIILIETEETVFKNKPAVSSAMKTKINFNFIILIIILINV